MERLTGFFHAVVAAGGLEKIVPEVPDEGGPGVVEHPLDDARGGRVFIARISLEHGALGIVGHGLGFAFVVVEIARRAVDSIHGVVEMLEVAEAFLAGVKIPHGIAGLNVFSSEHFFEARLRRNRGARANFGGEAVGAPGFRCVSKPVVRRRVVVGTAHFYAGAARQRRDVFRSRGQNRIGPVEFLERREKWALDSGGGRLVAAVEPEEHAGMRAQPLDFRAQGSRGDFDVALFPVRPLLPVVAAGPPSHDENALLVGQIEKVVRFHGAFEADRVEVQVAQILKLCLQAFGRFAQEHVRRPASAADQDVFAVDAEEAMALRVDVRSDFANAVAAGGVVGFLRASEKPDG